MKIVKVRDVKTPTRGTSGSAGLDFYVPNDFPGKHYLASGQSVNIPSGIHMKIKKGYALIFMNKSGIALKKGLQVGACVIDEDYQGEVHLHVTNIGLDVVDISPGEKLVQGLLLEVDYDEVEEIQSIEELYTEKTERGEGGFGSTNEKEIDPTDIPAREDVVMKKGDKFRFRFPYHSDSVWVQVTEDFTGDPGDNMDKLIKIPLNEHGRG